VKTVIQGADNTITTGGGTSFACPNMAGLATCLWQGFPEYNNMKIIDALRRAASHFEAPDDSTGYGIPDMKKALLLLLKDYATDSVSACKTLSWTSKDVSSMRYEIERQKQGETGFTKIGEQGGSGTVFQTHTYQFTDPENTATDGLVHYRIRQIIDTAAATFSAFYVDTVTVSLSLACTPIPGSENGIQIIPNPVQQSFHVKMNTGAVTNLQFVVVNAIGQTVYNEHTSKSAGMAVFKIEMPSLAPGVYFLTVYDAGKRLATKPFVKL